MFRTKLPTAAIRIAAIYLAVGVLWIFLSDYLLSVVAADAPTIIRLSIAKGWLFVFVTAAIIFILVARAMREIGQSRDFYLKVLDDFPSPVWRAGTDSKCNYFNRTWLAFTGRTLEQERGDGWADGVHPDDLDRCLKTYRESFDSRKPFTLEYRLRRHDGEYRWVVDHGRPFQDKSGKFAGYIGSCHDVTEQMEAVRALSRSERRYRELAENTSDWVWEVDADLRYVYVSPKVEELLGYAQEEVLGRTPFDFMIPEEMARLRPAIETVGHDPRPFKDIENVNMRKDGSLVVLETSGVPLYDADGRFAGMRGIDRDISARKEADEKIRKLNEELASQAAALEDFGHSIAHDLRTPLTSISLSCQMLVELCGENIKEPCRHVLHDVCNTVDRMDQLITSLLSFSSISRRDLNIETVNLSETAKLIAAELLLGQPERRAEFKVADALTARGDASLFHIVLANLLGNAWKYTGEREMTVIEFGVTEIDGQQSYFVRDNGIGFDRSQIEQLFAPFKRLGGAKAYAGHGIGLATVQRIVQRHGGRIWAEGEEGKGATFYFTLGPEARDAAP